MDHAYQDRIREAAQLASQAMALIESVDDPTLTVGLSVPLVYARPSGIIVPGLVNCRRSAGLADAVDSDQQDERPARRHV